MRDWYSLCGHLPERMDPVNRLLWWRRHRPAIMNRAKYFLGWHEFLILHLGGVAVTDGSLAGKPIEVTHFPELATLGAALLAGLAAGDYSTLEEGAEVWIPPHRCSELDPQRVALHRENLEAYRE